MGDIFMKKILTAVLALTLTLTLSLAACSQKDQKQASADNTTKQESKADEFKPKDVTMFTDILDNLGNKDYYYLDTTGNTIKILDKAKFTAYQTKAKAITDKAMADQKVDMKNAKVYTYFRNANGDKAEKDYVVVYDASKTPTDLYEVNMKIDDKDEPTLKDAKKVDKAVDDNFKKFFKDEVK
jgi:hypothetical protein